LSAKGGVDDGNQKDVSSLQPAKENHHFYIKEKRACKEHKLTGILKDIKILDRIRSEGCFVSAKFGQLTTSIKRFFNQF